MVQPKAVELKADISFHQHPKVPRTIRGCADLVNSFKNRPLGRREIRLVRLGLSHRHALCW
jgi:hypothetical protein